jgi:hypothetical protein
MQGIGNALSSVAGSFGGGGGAGTGLLDLAGLGMMGGGLLQNIMAAKQQQDKLNLVKSYINDPSKLAAASAKLQQPLSQGLTTDVQRQVDANMAQRGLGSSPAIMADVSAQALAPYYLQQQQNAMNAFLQTLGQYGATPTQQPANVGGILQAMMMQGRGAGGGTTGGPPIPTPAWYPSNIDVPMAWTPQVDTGITNFNYNPSTMGFGGGS